VLSLSDIAQIEDVARVSATLRSVTQREARGGGVFAAMLTGQQSSN
jgi:hypothetical protein